MDIKYLPQMADQTKRSYLFVAIEHNKSVASAKRFLKAVYEACPFKITKILTNNGKEFTDRLFSSEIKTSQTNMNLTSYAKPLALSIA